jgi:pSer/pThr/pTyr-binding forkhead associated (FHA) protein
VLPGVPPSARLVLPAPEQSRLTIGRDQQCDLVLTDETVSRWHAALDRGSGGWLLSDLGSTNGTWLNGWRVTSPVRVLPGDRVSFGPISFLIADRPGRASVLPGPVPAPCRPPAPASP